MSKLDKFAESEAGKKLVEILEDEEYEVDFDDIEIKVGTEATIPGWVGALILMGIAAVFISLFLFFIHSVEESHYPTPAPNQAVMPSEFIDGNEISMMKDGDTAYVYPNSLTVGPEKKIWIRPSVHTFTKHEIEEGGSRLKIKRAGQYFEVFIDKKTMEDNLHRFYDP